MRKHIKATIIFFSIGSTVATANNNTCLPNNFVYLEKIAPSIQQDIRYAGYHNFIGRPVDGYSARECILTRKAAVALKEVQTELDKIGLFLKVYDCYRPTKAVRDFMQWSKKQNDQAMKNEFYPHVNKKDFFNLGYVAEKSGHSRGSTVDLTIAHKPLKKQATYAAGQALKACTNDTTHRFKDNSIDMGTGYDCMDEKSHNDSHAISYLSYHNRMFLKHIMEKHGFVSYEPEWWHFTLSNEPYPNRYFDCDIHSTPS